MKPGTTLIWVGLAIAAIGFLSRFVPETWYSWFGHLPGDIQIRGENSRIFAPISSMLVVSVVLSLIAAVITRLFRGE